MNVPGSNLLAQALTVICSQPFRYYRYKGKTINRYGIDIIEYEPPVTLRGSIQAVGNDVYHERGLDFQKQYIEVWTERDTNGFFRGKSSDQMEHNGRRYQLVDEDDWHPIDGWDSFLAVEVATQ